MQTTKFFRTTRLAAVIAAMTVGVSAPVWAEGNDADMASAQASAGWSSGALTREQVRAELQAARESGTLTPNGQLGDSTQVLAARDAANRAQTEELIAGYRAEQERQIAAAEAEIRRAAIEADGAVLSALVPERMADGSVVAVEPEAADIRVDVIRLDTNSLTTTPEELVVVAVEGGDEATQLQRAEAVRRQLTEMGLRPDQIYIEASNPSELVAQN